MKKILFALASLILASTSYAQFPEPGHSHLGEAFDEGARQLALPMAGTGHVSFQADECLPEAQKYINQAIGQLHGFLHYESERSFRHAAFLDPQCVTAFWGMAMANTLWLKRHDRALAVIQEARKRFTTQHSQRLELYIQSIEQLEDPQNGVIKYIEKLRQIFHTYPDDLDAKAFFIAEVWSRRLFKEFGFEEQTIEATTAHIEQLAKEILNHNPKHPVHHYIIHMWDQKPLHHHALNSADVNGLVSPGIAHMWHMAGHTYTHADLPFEAWWSQEASARVDHKYMAQRNVLPFLLHNHAHNNEWLSRTLINLGDFAKAWQIALNLLALPKHPTFNNVKQYMHIQSGARRVLDLIEQGQFWDEGHKLLQSPLLSCDQFKEDILTFNQCQRVSALTLLHTDQQLQSSSVHERDYRTEVELVESLYFHSGGSSTFYDLHQLPHLKTSPILLRYALKLADTQIAADLADELLRTSPSHLPLWLNAALAYYRNGDTSKGASLLAKAQSYSEHLDLYAPEISAICQELMSFGVIIDASWKKRFTSWRPIHTKRPSLDSLGPLLWQPQTATSFRHINKHGQYSTFDPSQLQKPTLVVFVLNECPLCDLQVHELNARKDSFDKLNIDLVVITSQPENHAVFQKWRAYDEFEKFPLHGLYLVNTQGQIIWEDISAVAFMELDFLIDEFTRILHPFHELALQGLPPP